MIEMIGNNASGADNQQERPGIADWIVGFVDGEGTFSVSVFYKSNNVSWMAGISGVCCDSGMQGN